MASSITSAVVARVETARANRFLAALPLHDYSLLAPHLRTVELERGVVLHDDGEPIDHVYFPHKGMVSVVTIMRNGATVETASLGRTGVIGGTAALGARRAVGRAIVQLPGTASRGGRLAKTPLFSPVLCFGRDCRARRGGHSASRARSRRSISAVRTRCWASACARLVTSMKVRMAPSILLLPVQ